MTETLLAAGHRRIMLLTECRPDGATYYARRIKGFKDALTASGIPFDSSLIHAVPVDYGNYLPSATGLVSDLVIPPLKAGRSDGHATAMFVLSDFLALATVKSLGDSGIRVPDDLSVASFGGWSMTRYLPVTLQSWVQPIADLFQATLVAVSLILAGKPFSEPILLNDTRPDDTHGNAKAVSATQFLVPGYMRKGQSVRTIPSDTPTVPAAEPSPAPTQPS